MPLYLHPSMPHPAVIDVYYKEYAKDFPVLLRAAWGYTVETATLAILALSSSQSGTRASQAGPGAFASNG